VQKGRTKSVACRYLTIEVKVMGKKICTNKSLSLITCICQFSNIYFISFYLYIIRTYLIFKTSVHKKYLCSYAHTYFLDHQCTNANGRRRRVCRFACSYLSLICLNVRKYAHCAVGFSFCKLN